MDNTFAICALLVCFYLVGAIPWGVVLGRWLKGIDPRKHGSGGTGATNSLRLLGRNIAISVLVLDILKGAVPVILARALDFPDWGVALAAILPVVGHCWSPYIAFKGGKGVATGGGAAVSILPWLATLFLLIVVIIWLTRYVSLASLTAAAVSSVACVVYSMVGDFPWWWTIGILVVAAIIVVQHRGNIQRLLAGNENKFGVRVSAS